MAISRGRQTLHFLGHLWLQSLKRAIWIVVIGVAISGIRLALSQSGNGGDMMSEDMENSSNMSMPGVRCPTDVACSELPPRCLNCSYNESCTYGKDTEVMCAPLEGVQCEVNRNKIKLCRSVEFSGKFFLYRMILAGATVLSVAQRTWGGETNTKYYRIRDSEGGWTRRISHK
jgi:hypothetical protein